MRVKKGHFPNEAVWVERIRVEALGILMCTFFFGSMVFCKAQCSRFRASKIGADLLNP